MSISASFVSPFNQLTPWSSFIAQKLIVAELINKFPVFYGAESCFVRFRCICTRAASLLKSLLPSILLYTWTTAALINRIWLDLIFAKSNFWANLLFTSDTLHEDLYVFLGVCRVWIVTYLLELKLIWTDFVGRSITNISCSIHVTFSNSAHSNQQWSSELSRILNTFRLISAVISILCQICIKTCLFVFSLYNICRALSIKQHRKFIFTNVTSRCNNRTNVPACYGVYIFPNLQKTDTCGGFPT